MRGLIVLLACAAPVCADGIFEDAPDWLTAERVFSPDRILAERNRVYACYDGPDGSSYGIWGDSDEATVPLKDPDALRELLASIEVDPSLWDACDQAICFDEAEVTDACFIEPTGWVVADALRDTRPLSACDDECFATRDRGRSIGRIVVGTACEGPLTNRPPEFDTPWMAGGKRQWQYATNDEWKRGVAVCECPEGVQCEE